ncbi:TM2 domain-containing protein [Gardnerella vaginalis]|uniref:TM2 domain-containing protein n=1 Tax=Gardnerella vaginalis TaxID=2702 RepID=UPI00200DD8AF|nr:TM2 domain-containing protein [Gardnerella vaginalis]UQA83342.1 TM2 domain-containing protein [Gardnerella vaginalis]
MIIVSDLDKQTGDYSGSDGQTQYGQPQYNDQSQQYNQAQPQYNNQSQYGAQPQYNAQPQYGQYSQSTPQYNQASSYSNYGSNYSSNTYRSSRNKIAAGLLVIFLGALGVHNFYLGFKGKAIAQLLISILSFGLLAFVSGIWAFIEGICILCSQPGSKWHKDADGAELQD